MTIERSAEEDIRQTLGRYAQAIDRRQWDRMDAVFSSHARYRFGDLDGSWRDFRDAVRIAFEKVGTTHHQLGNIMMEIQGATAEVETYFTAYHEVGPDFPDGLFGWPNLGRPYAVIAGGRYVDRFERDDGWHIAEREGIMDWQIIDPVHGRDRIGGNRI